jgi:hypothetical protein
MGQTASREANSLLLHKIKGVSDFVHRPNSEELDDKNTTFRKLDLFPSSGEGRHLLCWVPLKELTSITGQPMSGSTKLYKHLRPG